MLTDQPVGQRLTTEQALDRSHADIQVVVRRVGLLRLRKEHFIQLGNKAAEKAEDVELFTINEWTNFIDNAQYAIRDEEGGVRIGKLYWRKGEWNALLFAIARGGLMTLAHIPRTA